jgi:hypothetical protein
VTTRLDAVGEFTELRGRTVPAVLLLARTEARRMLTHPVYVFLVGWFAFVFAKEAAQGAGGRAHLHELLVVVLVYGGLTTLFVAGLVASSPRRSGAESMLAASPLEGARRTLATGLGVLVGPALVAGVLTVVLAWVAARPGPQLEELEDAFRGSEYLQVPLLWLGAGLLGVAAARWLPWPGALLAVCVGLIAWAMVSYNPAEDGRPTPTSAGTPCICWGCACSRSAQP